MQMFHDNRLAHYHSGMGVKFNPSTENIDNPNIPPNASKFWTVYEKDLELLRIRWKSRFFLSEIYIHFPQKTSAKFSLVSILIVFPPKCYTFWLKIVQLYFGSKESFHRRKFKEIRKISDNFQQKKEIFWKQKAISSQEHLGEITG